MFHFSPFFAKNIKSGTVHNQWFRAIIRKIMDPTLTVQKCGSMASKLHGRVSKKVNLFVIDRLYKRHPERIQILRMR